MFDQLDLVKSELYRLIVSTDLNHRFNSSESATQLDQLKIVARVWPFTQTQKRKIGVVASLVEGL